MSIPENLRYTNDHEWVKIDGNIATIGVTSFAIEQLGDITLVEMPQVDDQIEAGDTIGTIESVKAVSDMFAPLNGKVIELNEELEDAPEKVNEDCYEQGWMLKVELSNVADTEKLFDAAAYKKYLDSLDD